MGTQSTKRDAERSRRAILDAAEHLFATQGFEAVTMAAVGAAAGLSRGTPGYFFGRKEDLYRVVLERAAGEFAALGDQVGANAGNGEPTDLTAVVTAFVELIAARADAVRLLDRDGGMTVGSPQLRSLTDALAPLGPRAPHAALSILSLAWHPVAHPEVASECGLDLTDPEARRHWCGRIAAAAGDAGPPDAGGERGVTTSADARFLNEVVVGERKKKRKDKKGKKRKKGKRGPADAEGSG